MGLQQNLNDIQTNLLSAKTAIAQSISNKGVECSATDKLSSFAEKIDSITTGSTGGTGEKFVVPNGLKFGSSKVFDPTMFDVSNVTDMSFMFYTCSGLNELDLSNWNTANVTSMSFMFSNCSGLTSLNVSNWNVSNVTNMYSMFNNCSGLTSLNVSNWNVSNVTDMSNMFRSCSKLTGELDLSGWNISRVYNMNYMFSTCTGLTSLDLSNFNTSNLTDMGGMFNNCISLTNLQLNDLGHNEKCNKLDLSGCPRLTKDSILYLFNNAFDRATAGYSATFTIKLHSNTKALLTEEEIAIATNKGFTVV